MPRFALLPARSTPGPGHWHGDCIPVQAILSNPTRHGRGMQRHYSNTPIRVEHGVIPRGYRGTMATARHIVRLIRNGAKDLFVRRTAVGIFRHYGVPPKDFMGEIAALFDWVRRNIRYTRDIYRVELLHTPRRMLHFRAGDCDDMVILLASLLESTGHRTRLVVVGSNPRRPGLFTHIYLEAFHRGRWTALDPTTRHPMGWQPRAVRRKVISLRPK